MGVQRSLCVALLMAAALGGCATSPRYEERAYKGLPKTAGKHTLPSSRRGIDDDGRCRDYGFLPGTAEYARCRSLMRQERAKARMATLEQVPDL